MLVGEKSESVSTVFSLGDDGISTATLLQFLLSSVLITFLRSLFFTGRVIRNMSLARRTALMFLSVSAVISSKREMLENKKLNEALEKLKNTGSSRG
jgi:hypothetical protein